jgi:hypothetical protein
MIVKNKKELVQTGSIDNQQIEEQNYMMSCNKWRPYYYDMFNRVGNLTILSLCHEANKVIEQLHNINHQQITWHMKYKKLGDESWREQEFASLRIFRGVQGKERSFILFTQNEARLVNSTGDLKKYA